MSYTLEQQPTTPNAAYTRLRYIVAAESFLTNLPQFAYTMDLYKSDLRVPGAPDINRIVRNTQLPNTTNQANFDISRVVQGEIGYDYNWKVTGSVAPVNSLESFDVVFGYQYGTSESSSVEVTQVLVAPEIQIFPGVVDPLGNAIAFDWNFNSSSFEDTSRESKLYLTNAPYAQFTTGSNLDYGYYGLVNSEDYMTVTAYGDSYNVPATISVVLAKLENGTTTNYGGFIVPLTPPSGSFNTIGMGPQNIIEYKPEFSASLANGDWNLVYSLDDKLGFAYYINDKWDGIPSSKRSFSQEGRSQTFKQCSDEYTRFAFINKYGFWDYYNVYNPVRIKTDLTRSRFKLPDITYQNDYNLLTNEGLQATTRQNFLRSEDTYSIDTDYITKETAVWLEELLESPEVYIQSGSDFIPIVLTNGTYEHNNNTSRNKLFKYTIEWVTANPRRARL